MTSDPAPITIAAFNLVKAMIEANAAGYSSEVGPVYDTEGKEFGTFRVTVEKVEEGEK